MLAKLFLAAALVPLSSVSGAINAGAGAGRQVSSEEDASRFSSAGPFGPKLGETGPFGGIRDRFGHLVREVASSDGAVAREESSDASRFSSAGPFGPRLGETGPFGGIRDRRGNLVREVAKDAGSAGSVWAVLALAASVAALAFLVKCMITRGNKEAVAEPIVSGEYHEIIEVAE